MRPSRSPTRSSTARTEQADLLYDRDCGLCRWALRGILAWDRAGRVRPVALQDREAEQLLGAMGATSRMASWHLVTPAGRVHSAGAAVAPLLRLLPGGSPLAMLAERFPRATDRAYRWVARNRGRLGRLTGSKGLSRRSSRRPR